MNPDETSNPWLQIVAKAWADETFKNRLLSNPSAVFQEVGLDVPRGVQVRVVENTDQIVHLTLPANPNTDELSENELEGVSGGILGAAKLWMKIMGATPTQGEDRASGTTLTPSQQAKV
jgi:hypothetical protein